ncbi:sulfite exporter TauE/SafE family protein [Leptospirillum ferriphilum]|jgi:hypothetical protein|uniref:Uncharacterized protein n=2 Tax=Leptospirillum TaxID=179 RepID=A0A094W810_9BACT|nr:sulfite exporter TauE/SafE family protein [Leptospirillum ferriphilum]EDZ38836.1 MAG: Conserved hypothetical protein [Leptospirillum sp. Group II '5-way CG']KGA93633.1 hypothetical protein LptCag_0246 [Leptospirillum ferriphilum]
MILLLLESLGYGLLHGLLPDEHTWPITFSYAIGNATGKQGVRSGFYFSAAFAVQRAIASELAYLFLASWLTRESLNAEIDMVVGAVMAIAGWIVLKKKQYVHFHLLGHHHEESESAEQSSSILSLSKSDHTRGGDPSIPPRWAIIHGFIAGFGFGPFALFIYTTAAPHMTSPWTGFLPGLFFGLGTMLMLMLLGGIFGSALRVTRHFNEQEIRQIGFRTATLTLLLGGGIFFLGGIYSLMQLRAGHSRDIGNILIAMIMGGVALPVLAHSIWKVLHCRSIGPAGAGQP